MYDIISNFINHEWISNYTGDQGYVYALAGVVMVVLVVKFIDLVQIVFNAFVK